MAEKKPPVPLSDLSEEDRGLLAVEERHGVPVLRLSGGPFVPEQITVVDREGVPLASYKLAPAPEQRSYEPSVWAHLGASHTAGVFVGHSDSSREAPERAEDRRPELE
ncbi:hypothetical protein [Nocardiopsis potens]|uniref:hypothetical protein n=1 Tax=Nocardiopsis potens TaxID=1246458 RepID=UPI000349DFE8|nr:hypothetical protein [Nocardiopsis potens]